MLGHAMKDKKSAWEKRKYPRVKKRVSFKFRIMDDLISAETLDLSGNGALCRANAFLPPMSRLDVLLALPIGDKTEYVSCNGVVVRVEKEESADSDSSDAYQIAIFFEEIEDDERDKILRHINATLSEDSDAPPTEYLRNS